MYRDKSSASPGIRFAVIIMLLILLLNLDDLRSGAFSSPRYLPEEMMGSSYLPEDDSEWIARLPKEQRITYTEKPYFLPTGLSDWERLYRLELEENKIESIRIFISSGKIPGKNIDGDDFADVTIKDPKVCSKFSMALQPRFILRKLAADFGRSHGGYGAGASLGVMKVRYKGVKKPLIIGIAKIGFYLDVWHGNIRQEFYSKALAVTIDYALRKYSNLRMPEKYLADQSGSAFLTLPDELKDLDKQEME